MSFAMWFDSEPQDLPEVLQNKDSVLLGPGERFVHEDPRAALLGAAARVDEVLVRGRVYWKDQFGVEGEEGPGLWRIDVRGSRRCEKVYGEGKVRALLGDVKAVE